MVKTLKPDNLLVRRAENERLVEGITKAVHRALLEHKRAGNPIAIWENDQVVWIPAEEIDVPAPDAPTKD